MIDNKGNKWIEYNYECDGVFGGKDIFVLIAEMNGLYSREDGALLYYNKKNNTIFPNLVRYYDESIQWNDILLCTDQNNNNNNYFDESDNDN